MVGRWYVLVYVWCGSWMRAVVSGAGLGGALRGDDRGDRGELFVCGRRSGYFGWKFRPKFGSSSGRILGLTAKRSTSCRFSAPRGRAEPGRWTGRAVGLAEPARGEACMLVSVRYALARPNSL